MAAATEQLMERVTKLPMPQKVAILVFFVVAVSVGNWFLLIDGERQKFYKAVAKMRKLEDEVINAQAIANNLNQYRKEKELLEQQLAKALTELPEQANVEDLIQSLHMLAQKAGLNINFIEPLPERPGEGGLYSQIPLNMSATGNFHEVAVFFDSIRQLKRIVNVASIKLANPRLKNDAIQVDATYTATAFRFVPQAAPAGKDNKGAKK
jgi:type IV pilus assembly protein PilO